MVVIELVVEGLKLYGASSPVIVSGNKNSLGVQVKFDSEWDTYTKSAVFMTKKNKSKSYEVVLDSSGSCVIPSEVLNEPGSLIIGVRGVNPSDNSVKATLLSEYKVMEGAKAGNETSVKP